MSFPISCDYPQNEQGLCRDQFPLVSACLLCVEFPHVLRFISVHARLPISIPSSHFIYYSCIASLIFRRRSHSSILFFSFNFVLATYHMSVRHLSKYHEPSSQYCHWNCSWIQLQFLPLWFWVFSFLSTMQIYLFPTYLIFKKTSWMYLRYPNTSLFFTSLILIFYFPQSTVLVFIWWIFSSRINLFSIFEVGSKLCDFLKG